MVWRVGRDEPQRRRDRLDLLGGLLACVCGRRLRNDGTFADRRHRLGLSHSTVKQHLAKARSSVGATTTAQLV